MELRETMKRRLFEALYPRGIVKRFNGMDEFRIYFPCRREMGGTARDSEFEPQQYRRFAEHVRRSCLFFDVGAHYGIYSLAAAVRGARCVAFEPTPRSGDYLLKNLHLNGLNNLVSLERIAVADHVGEATFWVSGSLSGNALHKSVIAASVEPKPIRCPITTLDAYCAERGLKPDLVKIDVEGAELRVLVGMKRMLLQHRPTVFISLHPGRIEVFGDSPERLCEFLNVCDLQYEFISPTEVFVASSLVQ